MRPCLPPLSLQLWDLRTKEAVHTFKGNKAGVTHVHFSPDSKWVASGAMDGSVKVGGSSWQGRGVVGVGERKVAAGGGAGVWLWMGSVKVGVRWWRGWLEV